MESVWKTLHATFQRARPRAKSQAEPCLQASQPGNFFTISELKCAIVHNFFVISVHGHICVPYGCGVGPLRLLRGRFGVGRPNRPHRLGRGCPQRGTHPHHHDCSGR